MVSGFVADVSLPAEAQANIWRIFGEGESPRNGRSAFDLIESVIRKHVSSSLHQDWAISEIRGWFELIGNRRWLKPDMREPVADLIFEGVGSNRSETAIWAIGSIDRDLATRSIRSRWGSEETDSFADAVLTTLERACGSRKVLSAAGVLPLAEVDPGEATIPIDALEHQGKLRTFRHINRWSFDLIYRALHHAVGNLIDLVVDLQPERFESLIERLDHPVMQARAADYLIVATRASDHRKPLAWITKDSCDASIALAILHTLEAVNRLDADIESSIRMGEDRTASGTELHLAKDDLDAAASNLLDDLVHRLAALDPLQSARWIGELLSGAPGMLMGGGQFEKSARIDRLEKVGNEQLAHLVRHSWSTDLLAALCAGLSVDSGRTWTRHLAGVAWELRDAEPALAAKLAKRALDVFDRYVTEDLNSDHLVLDWENWHDREWVAGLGAALALSGENLDLVRWVSSRCRHLPLSVWDAEENYQGFSAADRAAQAWFLVALHAVGYLKEINRPVDPAKVRDLAEAVWAHCCFADQYLQDRCGISILAEHAARSAVEFGAPTDLWLLEQARRRRVGSRSLWALMDQRKQMAARDKRPDTGEYELVVEDVTRSASNRFGDGGRFGFESLHYWGRLWILLGATEQAGRTAKMILAYPSRLLGRGSEVLILELLTLRADAYGLDKELRDWVVSTYRKLWPMRDGTIDLEREDRQRIDEQLKKWGIVVP